MSAWRAQLEPEVEEDASSDFKKGQEIVYRLGGLPTITIVERLKYCPVLSRCFTYDGEKSKNRSGPPVKASPKDSP